MESQITELVKVAEDILSSKKASSPNEYRVLIAIVGIPGSGKTTLAREIVRSINISSGSEIAAMVPMDGYHLSRAQLDRLPDPATAHFRRGAPFTFDPTSLLTLIHCLHNPHLNTPTSPSILAPSFSHSLKDPVPHDIPIHPFHNIIVFEGLYLGLNLPVWRDIAAAFDQLWYVDVEREVAKERLVKRHLNAGIVSTVEEGERRAEENDLPNGDLVRDKLVRVDRRIPYVEDKSWAQGVYGV